MTVPLNTSHVNINWCFYSVYYKSHKVRFEVQIYLVKKTLQEMCTFQINILMTKLLILCHWCFSSNFSKIFGIYCSSLKTSKFLTLFPSEFFPFTLFCIASVWMSQKVINRWNRAEKSILQKEKTSLRSCHERQFSAQEKPYQWKDCKV